MKIYRLSAVFSLMLIMPSLVALGEDVTTAEPNVEEVKEVQISEVDICEKLNLANNDKLKMIMNSFSDEEFIKILFYSKLLQENYPLYLCEVDKVINKAFEFNKSRFNFNNAIRLLKTTIFFGCSLAAGFVLYNNQENLLNSKGTSSTFALVSGLFAWLGCSEVQKISNNFDQNQLLYKAIAMKNALLSYQNQKK